MEFSTQSTSQRSSCGHSQILRQALLFVAFLPCEKDANDTFIHLLVIPRQVSNPLNCAGHVLFKTSWQTRESSMECWQFRQALVRSAHPKALLLSGYPTSTGLFYSCSGRAGHTQGQSAMPLSHPLGSQLLLYGTVFPIPGNCCLTGTLQVWAEVRV